MAETNSGWQHQHLQADFRACVKRQLQFGKIVFGAISPDIDPLPERETFQAGGTLQVVRGKTTTSVHGDPIVDPTGLGWWSGVSFIGHGGQSFSTDYGISHVPWIYPDGSSRQYVPSRV